MQYTKVLLFTEGESDAAFLNRILPDSVKEVSKIVVTGGYSSMISQAKSILIDSNVLVHLIMDADTVNTSLIEDKKQDILYLFTNIGKRDHVRIFNFIPYLEIIFFENENLREKLFSKDVYSRLLAGESHQKIIKEKYKNVPNLIRSLSHQDIELIRENSQVKHLLKDINEYVDN